MMTFTSMMALLAAFVILPVCARLGGPGPLAPPSMPETPLGYWAATFTGPKPSGANIWICFAGTPQVDYMSKDDCKPSVSSDFDGLVFTNIGGGSSNGVENSITLKNMEALPKLAEGLRSGGFDGISFDFESVSGFATYDELKDSFVHAIDAFKNVQMLTLLTVSRSGWSGSLSTGFPEGKEGFAKFQTEVGPLFDIFSPQCYGTGKETGPVDEICGVSTAFRADYSNWKSVQLIMPSVGSVWLEEDGASDPLAQLRASPIWPSNVSMPGYAVWVVRGECPAGMNPYADTPTEGICTCGTDWADANTNPSNPKC